MSNLSCCDSKIKIFKIHDMCLNPTSRCQKQVTFTTHQYIPGSSCFKNTIIKTFEGGQKAWDSFFKPALDTLAPVIGMAVGAQRKNPHVDQAATIILKSLSGGKFLSVGDMEGKGLRLKVMSFQLK